LKLLHNTGIMERVLKRSMEEHSHPKGGFRMRIRMLFAIVICVMGAVLTTNTTRAATPSMKTYLPIMIGRSQSSITGYPPPATPAEIVVSLTNDERAKVGCPALVISSQLSTAAQSHTGDMATHKLMSHTGSDGSSPWDRINATGYQFRAAAENVAMGFETPADVVNGWMNSAGHRANILNCDLHEIGVGYATDSTGAPYWTQDFATPR
jgi:uncharacterized protein YkwD